MLVGYARVSTQDQNPALQLAALRSAGCERIFEEKASGAQRERPEPTAALAFVRKGDTLVVWKLDRLARSLKQLIETVELLAGREIGLRSLTESIDTTTAGASWSFTSSGHWRSSSAPSSASARRPGSRPRGPGAGPAAGRRR